MQFIREMRATLLYCFVVLLFGCKAVKTEKSELGFSPELKKRFIEGPSIEDCGEEISKFENVYLDKVKDLEGYSWDQERFTATVEISENKRLYISLTPVGDKCDSVRKSVTFVVPKNYSYEDNKNEIIADLLWVSKLLCNEEEYGTVEKKLDEIRDSDIKNNQGDFVILYPKFNNQMKPKEEEQLVDSMSKSFMAVFFRELDSSRYSIMYSFQ